MNDDLEYADAKSNTLILLSKIGVDAEDVQSAYDGITSAIDAKDISGALAYSFYAFILEVTNTDAYSEAVDSFKKNLVSSLVANNPEYDKEKHKYRPPSVPSVEGYNRVITAVAAREDMNDLDALIRLMRAFILVTDSDILDDIKDDAVLFNHRTLAGIMSVRAKRRRAAEEGVNIHRLFDDLASRAGDNLDAISDSLSEAVDSSGWKDVFPEGKIDVPMSMIADAEISLEVIDTQMLSSPGITELRFADVVKAHPYTMAKYADALSRMFFAFRVLETLGLIPREHVERVREAFEKNSETFRIAISASSSSVEGMLMKMVVRKITRNKKKGD